MSAVLALFALAAGNDLSELRVDAGGTGSGPSLSTTTPTTATEGGGVGVEPSGTGTTVAGGSGTGSGGVPAGAEPGTGQPGAGGLAPGGGIVTASTGANAGAGLPGSSTTAPGALPGIPLDTGLGATDTTVDGSVDASVPGGVQPGDTALGDGTGGTATTVAGPNDGPAGSGAPGSTTASGQSAGSGSGSGSGESTNTTTAATGRPGDGSPGGLVATVRLMAIMIAFGASAAGMAWLTASLVRAILTGRRQRRPEDDEDDDDSLEALVVIDPASAGWTLEQLRRRLEAEPDPRLAIREAYSVVESGFGIGGGLARRRTETALQYLERTLGMIEGGTKPLRVLTGLFLLARFSNRPMNEAMRRAAIDAVVELQARFRAAEEVAA
ncbi:MAG: DUF4129 domain-containing protein [Acidimicrobiales bacterium]